MPGNKCNGNSNNIPGRHERLMQGRERRRSGRASLSFESPDNSNNYCNGVAESFEHEVRLREENNSGASDVEQCVATARSLDERDDGKPFRQRLLVVANRLPVSAVRKGEDSWSLEISAGGLVSALLGMC